MSARPSHCPGCGLVLSKVRSPQDHRRFFAIISKAFEHWPSETHQFKPSSPEHLRSWLLCEAGYFDVASVPLDEELAQNPHLLKLAHLTIEASVAAALRDRDYAFHRFSAAGCEILRARSINWETLDQKSFGPIRQAVEEIIETAIGVTAEQLLREKAA